MGRSGGYNNEKKRKIEKLRQGRRKTREKRRVGRGKEGKGTRMMGEKGTKCG